MPEIPECLNRRYQALDQLFKELAMSSRSSTSRCSGEGTGNAGIKMMCDFWDILKEDPDFHLKNEVEAQMGMNISKFSKYGQSFSCYMCAKDNKNPDGPASPTDSSPCCGQSPSANSTDGKCSPKEEEKPSKSKKDEVIPPPPLALSKVLCNLKLAQSQDQKCTARINELMETQNYLQEQIIELEQREKEGVLLLKQADCMWACMEEAYKKKLADSLQRQKILLTQLKQEELNNAKWKKNKKDLECQLEKVDRCHRDFQNKINQKLNDIKCLEAETKDFEKRILSNKSDSKNSKSSLSSRRNSSDAKIASAIAEIKKHEDLLQEEKKNKNNKEKEGAKLINEAREELQNVNAKLLEKKLENEGLRSKRDGIQMEIEELRKTAEGCKDICAKKEISVVKEIKTLTEEIANFKAKCLKCHECVDTSDGRRFCTDCPRCAEGRECLYEDDHCVADPEGNCVCMNIKHKFLDNVFENMYTVLEKESKTGAGKAVAESVLKCLRRSKNGKLNGETIKVLQEFILATVKKNLNLTIVGGAVKTRCEMDPDTYKELMLCLKTVTVPKPPKVDKSTAAKKASCQRWGGTSECNCPKGPKACICTKKAPPPPGDSTPYKQDPEDKPDKVICPHKDGGKPCGADCLLKSAVSGLGAELTKLKKDSCQNSTCPHAKKWRAAQCVLGPQLMTPLPKSRIIQDGKQSTSSRKDISNQPRNRIIEEVIGKYSEVTPIEKVSFSSLSDESIYVKYRKM